MSEIDIVINGDLRRVPADWICRRCWRSLGSPPRRWSWSTIARSCGATALAGVPVSSGDHIEIVHFVGGG